MNIRLWGICRHRAAWMCVDGAKTLEAASKGRIQFDGPSWNGNTSHLIRLAHAHCELVLHQTFADSVSRAASEVGSTLLSRPGVLCAV